MGTGEDALIAGFVVSGASSKILLIRAVGPGLTAYGVQGVLNHPVHRVFLQGDSLPVYQNDDWGSNLSSAKIATTAQPIASKFTR